MKGWNRKTWMGCVVALALGVPLAHAEGGTIMFSGAVVTPTCSFGTGDVNTGGECGASASASSHAQLYRQDSVALENALNTHDRLLNYFAGYAHENGQQLLTRTYE
ncbi:type 1 fimbrial protein [Dyella sp. C11]|uniref:type 1 fimbrial protein n=1 Tax=Dyella sp. C11 TaxID=2126991 RepID=UPI000D65732B|nr:type 1 fimbrial protein [Dyella sp. C11]